MHHININTHKQSTHKAAACRDPARTVFRLGINQGVDLGWGMDMTRDMRPRDVITPLYKHDNITPCLYKYSRQCPRYRVSGIRWPSPGSWSLGQHQVLNHKPCQYNIVETVNLYFSFLSNYLFIYVISITCRMVLWSFSVALKLRKSSWKMPHTRINNFTQLFVNSLCLISNCFLAVSRVRGCGVCAAQTATECDTRHYRDHTAAAVARWLPRAVMDIMGRSGNEGPWTFHNHGEGPYQHFHIY